MYLQLQLRQNKNSGWFLVNIKGSLSHIYPYELVCYITLPLKPSSYPFSISVDLISNDKKTQGIGI
jgi:hypothetical protein